MARLFFSEQRQIRQSRFHQKLNLLGFQQGFLEKRILLNLHCLCLLAHTTVNFSSQQCMALEQVRQSRINGHRNTVVSMAFMETVAGSRGKAIEAVRVLTTTRF